MITRKHLAVLSVAICVYASSALASEENQVTRPLTVTGHVEMVVDLATGEMVMTGAAHGSHLGQSIMEGVGNLQTGGGHGVITAANGDGVLWHDAGPNLIVFDGGTGRLEGVSGGFSYVTTQPETTYPGAGTMVIAWDFVGEGTITY